MVSLSAPGGRPSPKEIAASLREHLADLSDGKLEAGSIVETAHLFDYGYVDSLSAVSFLAHVEDRYAVRIDDVDLVERYYTLEAIARHIHENL